MKKQVPKIIRSAINKIKGSMDEVKFLLSDSYRVYLEKIVRGITGNYRLRVVFTNNICTDGKVISVNPVHEVINKLGSLSQKTLHILGNLAHETFHIKYTDFSTLEYMWSRYKSLGEFKVMQLKYIFNIIEDGAIELIGTNYYTGTFRQAVIYKNNNYYEHASSLEEMRKAGEPRLSLFMNALTLYSKNGKVKGDFEETELKEIFLKAMPIVDQGRLEPDSNGRLNAAIEIFELIQPLVEEVEKDWKQQQQLLDILDKLIALFMGSFERSIKKEGGTNPEKAPEIKVDFLQGNRQSTYENLKSSLSGNTPSGSSGDITSENDETKEAASKNEPQAEAGESQSTDPQSDKETENLLNNLENQLENIKDEAAEEEFNKQEQIKREEEILQFARNVKYSSLHQGIRVLIDNLKYTITDEMKNKFESEFKSIEPLSKNLTRDLQELIKFNEEDIMRNMYSGKLRTASLSRSDKRFFSQRKEKSEEADLAIVILVDQSGSMYGDRIRNARYACMLMNEVCKKLKIPLSIIGHVALEKRPQVVHYHYIDFDSYNTNDKYKLSFMQATENTREGVSLKYAAEYLLKRPETDKLLISISDGAPYHDCTICKSYEGEIAQNDAARVVKEYDGRMKIFGLAIGSGQDEIKQIYNKNFINISNINMLPKKLVNLIKMNMFK